MLSVLVVAKSLRTPPPVALNCCEILHYFSSLFMSVEYTPSKRGRILQLHDLNYSYSDIAKIVDGVSKSAAQETVKREELHNTQKSLPRLGRPAAVSSRDHHKVLQDIKRHHFDPYKKVAERLGSLTEQQVRTIAHQAGYH